MINRLGQFLSQASRYAFVATVFKLKLTDRIKIKEAAKPIYLRRNTSDIPTFNQIFTFKEYDIHLKNAPEYIIDAGANVGLAAIYFTNRFPNAKIISIEPEKTNYEMLVKNTKDYKNVIPHKKALSNEGDLTVNVLDDGFGNWSFKIGTDENSDPSKIIDRVTTVTIDQIMQEYNLQHLDLVKIDIESAEKELFSSNYENWLPKTKCLVVELHDFMKPGCSTSFFKAISKYDFSYSHKGENLIFKNQSKEFV